MDAIYICASLAFITLVLWLGTWAICDRLDRIARALERQAWALEQDTEGSLNES